MTKYKCGHESRIILFDDNPLTMSAWLRWKDSVGLEGTKEKCWECFCKENGKP